MKPPRQFRKTNRLFIRFFISFFRRAKGTRAGAGFPVLYLAAFKIVSPYCFFSSGFISLVTRSSQTYSTSRNASFFITQKTGLNQYRSQTRSRMALYQESLYFRCMSSCRRTSGISSSSKSSCGNTSFFRKYPKVTGVGSCSFQRSSGTFLI